MLELLRIRAALDLGALPRRPVGVLDRQRRQGGARAGQRRRVERRQLGDDDLVQGVAVEDRVVQGQVHARVVVGQPRQPRAQQRTARDVERAQRIGGGQPHGLGLARLGREATQVVERHVERERGQHALDRASFLGHEHGAPGFVARRELGERLRERGGLQRAAIADRDGLVVERDVGRELGVQPDLLLGERQRRRASVGAARNGGGGRAIAGRAAGARADIQAH